MVVTFPPAAQFEPLPDYFTMGEDMQIILRRFSMLVAIALPLLAACASGGNGSGTSAGDPDLLTAEQLEAYQHMNAYDAIRQTRPQWLRSARGRSSLREDNESMRGLRVYVDGVLFGGASDLQRLEVRAVHDVRFLDSREATLRYGTNHAEGALVVRTAG